MTAGRTTDDGRRPSSLTSVQVDLTTRLGAESPYTPTGFAELDSMLSGGLRAGMLVTVSGDAGAGKTSLALMIGYMAARAGAAVLFASVSLDDTEVVARLAARAVYREWPGVEAAYGAIWSGLAWREESARPPLASAVDTVMKKVGSRLYLLACQPFDSTQSVASAAAQLWSRHERVLVVVDGAEALSANEFSPAVGDTAGRVLRVAHELKRIAEQGCAVLATVSAPYAAYAAPAATLSAGLEPASGVESPAADVPAALGARPVNLVVGKNRYGATGTLPLWFVPGASVFEERSRP